MAELYDFIQLLRCLSLKRVWNIFLLHCQFWYSKTTKNLYHKALPYAGAYEPTTSCNLKCPMCPSGLRKFTRETGFADGENFYKMMREIGDYLTYFIFYFQGEPFLNKKIFEWIRIAVQRKIYTAASTNAHHITPEVAEKIVLSGLSRLIVSLDGASQETYQLYRIGGNFEKVLEGLKNIHEAKKKFASESPFVILQNIVFKHNEHELGAIKALGKKYSVGKVVFKTAQIYDYENGSDFIPDDKNYSRYEKNHDGTYRIKTGFHNSCWKMWHSFVMTWDGKIVPCCFDKDAEHRLGDISQKDFREIWFGEKYQSFRKKILKNRREIDICKNCTEGLD